MTTQVELIVQRRLTRAFIKADEEKLSFTRPVSEADGKGGQVSTATVLPVQRVRVIPLNTRSTANTISLPTGETYSARSFLLMGRHDMDIAMDDEFMWQERAWRVGYIYPERKWSTIAHLDLLGEDATSTI